MRIEVEECRKLRRASACMREADLIQIKVPRHWSKALKAATVDELVERLQRRTVREQKLLLQARQQARITIQTQAELEAYVRRINAETFNIPLGKIRIGSAKYDHLAQVNLRTKTMTVSKYCLHNAPAQALRYLVVHELAHYFESGHGPAFWALVARYVPDYKHQSQIIKAFHHQAVIDAESRESVGSGAGQEQAPHIKQLPLENTGPRPHAPRKKESSPWAGFFKQLLLWDS